MIVDLCWNESEMLRSSLTVGESGLGECSVCCGSAWKEKLEEQWFRVGKGNVVVVELGFRLHKSKAKYPTSWRRNEIGRGETRMDRNFCLYRTVVLSIRFAGLYL